MRHAFAFALALSLAASVATPSHAGKIEDLVRANCTREIVASTDVSRNAIKSFSLNKTGSGYVMRGRNEDGQTVTCEAAGDGHVTWVRVG